MAGDSKASLTEKLGLKAGAKALFVQSPEHYGKTLGPLPSGVAARKATLEQAKTLKAAPIDFIQCFCRDEAEVKAVLAPLKKALAEDGMLWISWPKKSAPAPAAAGSGKASKAAKSSAPALDDNVVRELGLAAGLVDVKVCAVDETWSALKFVYRAKDRDK